MQKLIKTLIKKMGVLKDNIINKLRSIFLNNWHVLLLYFIFLIPFLVTTNSDFSFSIGFDKFNIANLLQTWINKDFGSIPTFAAPIYFVYYFLIHILGHAVGSFLIWWLFYCISSVFLIFSFRELIKIQNKKTNKFSEFLIGFFYVFFIPLQYLPNSQFTFNLVYLSLPLVFFLILKFSNSKSRNTFKFSVIIAIALFFLTGIQMTFLVFLLFGLSFLTLYLFVENKIKLIEILKLFLLSTILYLALSAPYYYQSIYLPLKTQSNFIHDVLTKETPSFTQSNSFLAENYKLLGETSYYYYHKGQYAMPSAVQYFKDPIFIILSYIGILFFLFWLFVEKEKKIKIIFLLLFLISIFFFSGVHNVYPLDKLYNYLYNYFQLFSIFRNGSKITFIILYIYSIALGFCSLHFINKSKNKLFVFLIFFIPILLISKPLYQSNFYSHANIKIPNDVSESIDYINNNIKGISLIVPITPFPVYVFAARGVDPYEFSTNMRVLYNVSSAGVATKLLSQIKNSSDRQDIKTVRELLNKFNINYIIWNGYIDSKQYDMKESIKYLDFYKKNFKEIKNFNDSIIIFEV